MVVAAEVAGCDDELFGVDQVPLGSLLKLLRNLKGMALIEQGFPAIESIRNFVYEVV